MVSIYKARDETIKIEWERVRVLSFFTVTAQQGTKKIKRPKDLFPFTWEEEKKHGRRIMTQKEAEEREQEMRKNTN